MQRYLRTPKAQLAILLFLISLSALFLSFNSSYLILIITAVVATVGFDLVITYIRSKKWFIPYAAIVTGFIIGIIIDPTANILQVLTISLIAMMIKNFIRLNNRHILNPAASGLLIGGLIFSLPVAWWGVTVQNLTEFSFPKLIAFLILLLPAYISGLKLGRWGSIISFLLVYALILQFQSGSFASNSFISSLLNPSVIFFALVMLPEPMTSPVSIKKQFVYGTMIALLVPLLSMTLSLNSFTVQILAIDPLIIALLIGNIIFFKNR